ncbi:cytochrome P450 3A30-like [Epinephelus lanceolatus]|uniref:cytochrome P450 3A30-like n=1 Tax=Epinephelus lanceolatus TaxID=310571 RepID=UPI001444E3F8|nr:cytochrome P450 3A30-like [Epinephelus lanceolatus]
MDYLPFFSLETWILLMTFICLFVMYGNWTYGAFKKMGIPGPKPLMFLGSVCRLNPVYYLDDKECAQKYGRVWGTYELRKPMLVVMDPDMLKTILVKECFSYFTNRRNFRLNGDLYDSVSIAENDKWRRIRNILTPSFTSGRIKEMFSLMKHHSRKLTASMQSKAQNNEVIIVKDFFGAYSMDVMASCVFNVDIDSISNPSNPMITHATKLFRISIPLFMFQGCFPVFLPLLELLGVSLFPKTSTDFFKTLLEKVRAERNRSSHENSRDILQNMINSQTASEPKKDKQHNGLTDHEIFSQATIFVFAGYETSAITLVFLAYNLARNPEVMKRLQEEIDSTFPNKGAVQYEALMQMEYLDSVVNECLRLYPPAGRVERVAKETVEINGIKIPKNMTVMVPVYALHHDPELWPEPEEFKPDRFSKQSKQSINPYTYLPFGIGPRNCLGMRFALMMVKLALVEVLQNYSFSICEETEIPLRMDPKGLVGPLNPIKLKLETRSMTSGKEDKSY